MPLVELELTLPRPERDLPAVEAWSTSSDATYSVDLNGYSCTCPDFARRSSLPTYSIGRVCKHIAQAILDEPELRDQLTELHVPLLGAGGCKARYYQSQTKAGGSVVVGIDEQYPWADVLFRRHRKGDPLGAPTGPWALYGLDRETWSWSYGEGPRGARELKEILAPLRIGGPESQASSGSGAGCLLILGLAGMGLLGSLVAVIGVS